jgi:hypothetical protein
MEEHACRLSLVYVQSTAQAIEPGAVVPEDFALTLVTHPFKSVVQLEVGRYRLKGALLLMLPQPDTRQAERCFWQALTIARRQCARSSELRTVLCLSRLWQRQGKRAEARQLLAEIYH